MLTVDLDLLEINGHEFILDAGCGNGRHVWNVCKHNKGASIACDIDAQSLKTAGFMLDQMEQKGETKGYWHLVSGSITNLPFCKEYFHKVICSEVLEHIHDDNVAVRELTRVLKPGGILAVSVPTYFAESVCWKISNAYHNTPGGHIRIYKRHELLNLLKKNDLDIFAIRHKHAFHSIYWWLRGIFGLNNEKAFIPVQYYRFLVWDIYNGHKYTSHIENFLNQFFPKSTVIYCRKPNKFQ